MKKLTHQILSRETLYESFFRADCYHLRHDKFAGGTTEVFTREVFRVGPVAAVLPYDPDRDEIILIEQFRAGVMAAGEAYPWMLEPVTGLMQADETPEDVVRREAMEEAGCTLGELEMIACFHPSPGSLAQMTWLYAGKVSTEGIGGIYGLPEENEETLPHVFKLEDALRLGGQDRRFGNAVTLIALQWMALHRDRLRRLWAKTEPSQRNPR